MNTPLVLLHGFCEDGNIWKSFAEPLALTVPVFSPDLPGFGSAVPMHHTTIESMAEYVNDYFESSQITNAILIGHSMGGYVALAFAEKYPEKLSGVGLFHSQPFADSESKKNDRSRAADFVRKNGSAEYVAQLFPALFTDEFKLKNSDVLQSLIEKYSSLSPDGICEALDAMRLRTNRESVLRNLNIPFFCLLGKQDKLFNFRDIISAVNQAKISDLHLIDSCAHMGMLEQPENCRTALVEFLQLIETKQATQY